jgi:hypothetical protein
MRDEEEWGAFGFGGLAAAAAALPTVRFWWLLPYLPPFCGGTLAVWAVISVCYRELTAA